MQMAVAYELYPFLFEDSKTFSKRNASLDVADLSPILRLLKILKHVKNAPFKIVSHLTQRNQQNNQQSNLRDYRRFLQVRCAPKDFHTS